MFFFQHGYFSSYRFKYRFARFHLEGNSQNPTALCKRIFQRNVVPRGGGKRNPIGKFWKHFVPIRQSALRQWYPALAAFHADALRRLGVAVHASSGQSRHNKNQPILAPTQNMLTSGDDRHFHNQLTLSKEEIYFQRKPPFSRFSCLKWL